MHVKAWCGQYGIKGVLYRLISPTLGLVMIQVRKNTIQYHTCQWPAQHFSDEYSLHVLHRLLNYHVENIEARILRIGTERHPQHDLYRLAVVLGGAIRFLRRRNVYWYCPWIVLSPRFLIYHLPVLLWIKSIYWFRHRGGRFDLWLWSTHGVICYGFTFCGFRQHGSHSSEWGGGQSLKVSRFVIFYKAAEKSGALSVSFKINTKDWCGFLLVSVVC